ncbi:hypothetical protein HYDPIDRAFT_104501 [Hydnomerulius pinastri MD-312]|nr:hypothetical protein HYDPIDRAFT_104501 [Hydnomerulius pinastri MD-312]
MPGQRTLGGLMFAVSSSVVMSRVRLARVTRSAGSSRDVLRRFTCRTRRALDYRDSESPRMITHPKVECRMDRTWRLHSEDLCDELL